MGITQMLADEIVNTQFEDLPSAALERIKMAILDDIGIAFMGYQIFGKPLVKLGHLTGGIPESTIVGDGTKVSASLAAGINAEMASYSDFDETGPGVHALNTIAHTAIALGECNGISGEKLITAIALAYELNGRFSRNLKDMQPIVHIFPEHARRHLTLNPAICAAKLLDLDATQINHVISLAWTYIPPNMKFIYLSPKLGWPNAQHDMWSCELGIQSVLLVQNGHRTPRDILDYDAGHIYHLDRLTSSPSPYFYILNELCLKPWIGSYGYQGGIELAGSLVNENKINPDDIESIIFRGSSVYTDPDDIWVNPEPKVAWDAVGCVPWSIANAVLGYEPGPGWLEEASLKDPIRLNIARKVSLGVSESPYVNEVEIVTRDKTSYKQAIKRNEYLGSPLKPMSWEQVERKFRNNVAVVVGNQKTEKMLSMLRNIEKLENINELTCLYTQTK